MSEERLQEIKDSIEFQYTLAKAKGHEKALLFTDEEQELVEEIEKLKSIIKEVRECINEKLNINSDYVDYDFGTELLRHELLEILDKVEENTNGKL